jgi:hypothetical protein
MKITRKELCEGSFEFYYLRNESGLGTTIDQSEYCICERDMSLYCGAEKWSGLRPFPTTSLITIFVAAIDLISLLLSTEWILEAYSPRGFLSLSSYLLFDLGPVYCLWVIRYLHKIQSLN